MWSGGSRHKHNLDGFHTDAVQPDIMLSVSFWKSMGGTISEVNNLRRWTPELLQAMIPAGSSTKNKMRLSDLPELLICHSPRADVANGKVCPRPIQTLSRTKVTRHLLKVVSRPIRLCSAVFHELLLIIRVCFALSSLLCLGQGECGQWRLLDPTAGKCVYSMLGSSESEFEMVVITRQSEVKELTWTVLAG